MKTADVVSFVGYRSEEEGTLRECFFTVIRSYSKLNENFAMEAAKSVLLSSFKRQGLELHSASPISAMHRFSVQELFDMCLAEITFQDSTIQGFFLRPFEGIAIRIFGAISGCDADTVDIMLHDHEKANEALYAVILAGIYLLIKQGK